MEKQPSKADQVTALRLARHAARNTPEASGTARSPNPRAKATKGKAGTAEVNGLVRRSTAGMGLRVGEADAVQPATSENRDVTCRRDGNPIRKPGRPKIEGLRPWEAENISRSTYYRDRRKAEEKAK
jgi:hypothetical protein